jgi:hypothetical protein
MRGNGLLAVWGVGMSGLGIGLFPVAAVEQIHRILPRLLHCREFEVRIIISHRA